MNKFSDEEIIKVCESSISMREASKELGIPFTTFKRKAEKLGCYKTNQSGKGILKKHRGYKYTLEEIYNGTGFMQPFKFKNRLFREGIKENICECCGISEWLGDEINCELHHIDGKPNNNKLENLQILCPNCHSRTDTFRGKNKKK